MGIELGWAIWEYNWVGGYEDWIGLRDMGGIWGIGKCSVHKSLMITKYFIIMITLGSNNDIL